MSHNHDSIAVRVEALRRRVQEHTDQVNLLKGKIQSLEERIENCNRELEANGLTAEMLPGRISEIQDALLAKIGELESVLDDVGE